VERLTRTGQLERTFSVNKNAVVYSIEKLIIKCYKKSKNFIFLISICIPTNALLTDLPLREYTQELPSPCYELLAFAFNRE